MNSNNIRSLSIMAENSNNWSESMTRVLQYMIDFEDPVTIQRLAQVTNLSLQTVQLAINNLIEQSYIFESNDKAYQITEGLSKDFLRKQLEKQAKQVLYDINGNTLPSVRLMTDLEGTFFESTYLPQSDELYGCHLDLERLTTSNIVQIAQFSEIIQSCHYAVRGIYWTIMDYRGFSHFGIGIESLVESIKLEEDKLKAAVYITWAIEDWFGGFYSFFYHMSSRWINYGPNDGIFIDPTLTIVLDKIPIGKDFAISWGRCDLLPYVNQYQVQKQILSNRIESLDSGKIIGYNPDTNVLIISTSPIPITLSKINVNNSIQEIVNAQDKYNITCVKLSYGHAHPEVPDHFYVELYISNIFRER